MERVNIIEHEGVEIAFLDAKNLKNEAELCMNIEQLTNVAINKNIKFVLLDVTGTHTTPIVKETATKSTQKMKSHFGEVYSSLVGLSVLQRIIANAINRDQYFAKDIDDAKRWLASKSQ